MEKSITFKLEDKENGVGIAVPTLIKCQGTDQEEWCNVEDLDQLFNTCVQRWGKNWNLEKVLTAVKESEIN